MNARQEFVCVVHWSYVSTKIEPQGLIWVELLCLDEFDTLGFTILWL